MGELWGRLSENQKKIISWLAIAVVVGVGILLLQPAPPKQFQPVGFEEIEKRPDNLTNYVTWEEELTETLNMLLGGRRCKVFLTLERGPQLKVAHNLTEEERITAEGGIERRMSSTPVVLRNDGERREVPLVLQENEPIVRGVLVVVDHPPNSQLRLEIARAVATVLQVPMYRIEVLFKE